MTRPLVNHDLPTDPLPTDPIERLIAEELSRPMRGPDLTEAIMARLGYVQVSARRARARRWSVWAGRAGLAAAAMLAVVVGVELHSRSPRALRPAGPTIPAALNGDLQRHQRDFGQVIQQLRQLAPSESSSPGEFTAPQPRTPREMDEDVDRSAGAPFQWV